MTKRTDDRVALSRHAALKARTEGDVLVLPERAIRLGGSGGEILRLCNGERAAYEIIEEMERRYPETEGMDREVMTFLDEMVELGGVVWSSGAAEGRS